MNKNFKKSLMQRSDHQSLFVYFPFSFVRLWMNTWITSRASHTAWARSFTSCRSVFVGDDRDYFHVWIKDIALTWATVILCSDGARSSNTLHVYFLTLHDALPLPLHLQAELHLSTLSAVIRDTSPADGARLPLSFIHHCQTCNHRLNVLQVMKL